MEEVVDLLSLSLLCTYVKVLDAGNVVEVVEMYVCIYVYISNVAQ